MKKVEITSNSEIISATVFEGIKLDKILIIASATGVRQEFYQKFSEFLAENGITVITFDYFGIGDSLKEPIKTLGNNASDWGEKDLEAVINYAHNNYPDLEKIILGHSIGGQLIGLSKSSIKANKIILVAAQSGYWKLWSGRGRLKMWFNWHILFPTLINLFGYLPSKKISSMENLPKNVAKQWRNWGVKSEYLLSEIPLEQTIFNKIETKITAISIDDDQFAPKKAVAWMTEKYKNAKVKSVHLVPNDFGAQKIGHFGIFREKFKATLWQLLLDEMKQLENC